MSGKYLEDFAVGQVHGSARIGVDEENGDAVQVFVANLVVPRRPAA